MNLSKPIAVGAFVMALSTSFMATETKAFSMDSAVEKLVSYISKNGSTNFCRKGNIFTTTFSIRSFNGKLCTTKSLAGLATASCYQGNSEKFRNSKCYTKAKGVLGITDGMSDEEIIKKAKNAIGVEIGKLGSYVQKIACENAGKLPGEAGKIAKSKCPKKAATKK